MGLILFSLALFAICRRSRLPRPRRSRRERPTSRSTVSQHFSLAYDFAKLNFSSFSTPVPPLSQFSHSPTFNPFSNASSNSLYSLPIYSPILARFPPPKRDGPVRAEGAARGGRGGRGGSRGRGEARGGARNGAPRAAAKPAQTISFDATAFPSLA